MDVYLVPIARDRLEAYFEAADDDEPETVEGHGFFSRMRARFSAMLRDAERERHQTHRPDAQGTLARGQRYLMRWIAERIAEQRLLWHLGRADAATLHAPDDLDPAAADRLMREALQRDADRHLRLLVVHSIGLLIAAPFVLLPGPNLFGYFFTFTVVGHYLALRGARRGLSRVRWTVVSRAELTDLRRAFALDAEARHRRIRDVADRLRLQRLATFVERMAAPSA
jgi:hypothetical protein